MLAGRPGGRLGGEKNQVMEGNDGEVFTVVDGSGWVISACADDVIVEIALDVKAARAKRTGEVGGAIEALLFGGCGSKNEGTCGTRRCKYAGEFYHNFATN